MTNLKIKKARPSMLKHAQACPSTPKHSEQLLGTYRNLLNLKQNSFDFHKKS